LSPDPQGSGSADGAGSIIGAGSVVPEHTVVPPRTLWASLPAKFRRELTHKDRAFVLEYARNHLNYAEMYLKVPVS
jgi:carbonic anhydrase/acetyltransferase-like protein (isoleucine patch superfamily)